MKPRLRSLGLRVAVFFAIIAALFGVSIASPAPPLPVSLLASFDQALALMTEAVEQQEAVLEQQPATPPRSPTVVTLLARFEREVEAASRAAHRALATALAVDLPSTQRTAVLSAIGHHLGEARGALEHTTDPEVRAEYEQTCRWLREIRFLI